LNDLKSLFPGWKDSPKGHQNNEQLKNNGQRKFPKTSLYLPCAASRGFLTKHMVSLREPDSLMTRAGSPLTCSISLDPHWDEEDLGLRLSQPSREAPFLGKEDFFFRSFRQAGF